MSYLSNTQYTSGFTPTPAPQPHVLGNFSFPNPIASSSKGKAKALPSKNTTKTAKQKVKPATSSRSNTVSSIGDRPSSAYYRRDYQSQVDIDYDTMSTGSGAGPSSSQVPHHLPKHKSDHLSVKQSKPSRPSSRMVTILLTDIRSGVEDHQLAEVVVPLKDADTEHPEHGFWANAQEVVEKLQSTPSRIEGPARVYTMRGKYRQFFLRVHDDESNEVYPANLSVSEERTLEVVVETAPLPGELPAPPRIPRDLQPTPEPDDASSNSQYYEAREYNKNGRKRHRSPSDRSTVDYDGSYSIASPERQPSPNGSSSHHSTKKKKISENANEDEVNDSDAELFITPLSKTGQDWPFDYDSPTSDGDEDLDVKIVERLEPVLQMHPVEGLWESVFPLRRRLPRVSAYILLYRALEQFFEKYEGRRVPFKRNRNIRIQKIHILKALGVLDETDEFSDLADADKICANCSETLRLVSLYGPEGSRLQDPTVLEMMKDEDVKSPEGKPQKRFLRLLREVDEKWKAEHAEEPESNGEIRPPPEVASVDSSNNNSGDTRVSVE